MTGLKKAAFACVGMSLLAASAAAFAGQRVVVEAAMPRAVVSYADLDIGKPAGQARLRARVKSAASTLCLVNGIQPLKEELERRRCFREAMESAEPQIAEAIASGSTRLAARRSIEVALRR